MDFNLEPIYLYILSRLPVKKLETFEQWRQEAGSFEQLYLASSQNLQELGWTLDLIQRWQEIKRLYSVEKIYQSLSSTGVSTFSYLDACYPRLLKEIHDPPPMLFYRGMLSEKDESCLAIVGSRKMSDYGQAVLPKIAGPLIEAGLTIVSGLAFGIDSAAHNECLKRKSRTIAVLGSGIDDDTIYPRAHFRLGHQILDCGGLLLSEHPPGTPGLKQNFVARNRIIAGLSLGVVIVECKTKSGALLTADYAADFNRNLYAVPGPIYSSLSSGPHHLIQNGAMLVSSGYDILEDLGFDLNATYSPTLLPQRYSSIEQRVLKCMQEQPITIDELAQQLKLGSQEVIRTITNLELRGIIKETGDGRYMRT